MLYLVTQPHIVLPGTSDSQGLPVTPFIPGWGDICSVAIGRESLCPDCPPSPLAPKIFSTVSPLSQGMENPMTSFHATPCPTPPCHRRVGWACSLLSHAGCDFHGYGSCHVPSSSRCPEWTVGKITFTPTFNLNAPRPLAERGAQSRHPAASSHYFLPRYPHTVHP